jgi:DNA repair exonuclease SbcCD ATPase subunit
MKEISVNQKFKVIKLFLNGLSYDEISQQVGIAKGSVVNIINEFREGYISLPPGMVEYVDSLRKLVVDMKKHDTSVAQLKNYAKLHIKIKEMGVGIEHVDMWLDSCKDISKPSITNSQFVKAALELAELTSGTGLSYAEVINNHTTKLAVLNQLDKETGKKKAELDHLNSKYQKEKIQATKVLDSINKAIETAQEAYHKQKEEMESQLDEYMIQNKLSWDRVYAVTNLFNMKLSDLDLNKEDINKLSKRITTAGSLDIAIKELEQKKNKLQSQVDNLVQKRDELAGNITTLENQKLELDGSILKKKQENEQLNLQIPINKITLSQLNQVISKKKEDIYITDLVLGFLFSSNGLSDYNLDHFVSLMIALRQKRLGIEPKKVKDSSGKVICSCMVPEIHTDMNDYGVDVESAREAFAINLSGLVKDKFVTKLEHEYTKVMSEAQLLLVKAELVKKEKGIL